MRSLDSPGEGKALFISYDGLTDPLGASQILPYLEYIAAHPRQLHVLSFEKPERFAAQADEMRSHLAGKGIVWTPVMFTKGGKLSKGWDLLRMYVTALRLQRRYRFKIAHCRSYQAAQVGCLLKRLFGAKVIFDMRGLWVDERVDGGLWKLARLPDRLAFRTYKRIERGLLQCANHVVVLTHRVVPELSRLAPAMQADVTVIPCCADFEHFNIPSDEEKREARSGLGLPDDALVLSYLGSLGTWYMLDEMLRFFIAAAHKRADIHFLVITRDWSQEHWDRLHALGGDTFASRVHVIGATRTQVPTYIGASDVMLSFIKPAYSKLASSPTKLAEAHACGVPAICNPGIGDVDSQMERLSAGALVDPGDQVSVERVISLLDTIRANGGQPLRARAMRMLDLGVAAAAYRQVYDAMEAP